MKTRIFLRLFSSVITLLFLVNAPAVAIASDEGPQPKRAVLTYDDGPNATVTEALLEVLSDEQVPATFFLCAYRIRENPETVRKIQAAGHTIGVHGSTHQMMHKLTAEEIRTELTECIDAVSEITGLRVRYFRPPYGLTSSVLEKQAAELGLKITLWNNDPEDWRTRNSEKIAASVIAQASGDCIILLHDLNLQTVYATRTIIRSLQQQGYEFVTLDGF